MPLDPTSLQILAEEFDATAARLLGAEEEPQSVQSDGLLSPRPLIEAMQRILQLLPLLPDQPQGTGTEVHPDRTQAAHDIHQLGDYGFHLLADLTAIADRLKRPDLSREFEGLCLPLAVWIARRGGTLSTLEPIVNAIAFQANALREPLDLEKLYFLTGEVQLAVAPLLQRDPDKTNPGRPWRVLLFNRAIIATRSHRLTLIEAAYDDLIMRLPEDAPQFFRQGMEQMVALDYPQPVRNLVEKYYNLWSVERTLH